jgi:hypothetical protein
MVRRQQSTEAASDFRAVEPSTERLVDTLTDCFPAAETY